MNNYRPISLLLFLENKVCTYLRIHKLSLHPDKTKYMIVSNAINASAYQSHLYINNNDLDQNSPNLIHEIKRVA
jgi:hypothetical protein